jgi:carbonic anhydrase
MIQVLSRIPAGANVVLNLHLDFMDHGTFEALHSWRLGHELAGGQVELKESPEHWYGPAALGRPTLSKTPLAGLALR